MRIHLCLVEDAQSWWSGDLRNTSDGWESMSDLLDALNIFGGQSGRHEDLADVAWSIHETFTFQKSG
jgi:hypothetical protein